MFETQVYAFAQASLGGPAQQEILEKLCAAACSELLARLKEDVAAEDIQETFVTAAAVLALSMYCAIGEDGESFSFRAGNLSVSRSGGESRADSLRKQAEAMISAYLADRGFEFRSVEG